MTIKKGCKVTLEYVGTLEDGTEFDSSKKHGQPLVFTMGEKQVIPGLEEGIMGLKKGDEKDVAIPKDKAYGDHNEELVKKIPRSRLPPDELKEGMLLAMQMPNGMQAPARIVSINDDEATLDLNHPLAGKSLNFKVTIVDIEN